MNVTSKADLREERELYLFEILGIEEEIPDTAILVEPAEKKRDSKDWRFKPPEQKVMPLFGKEKILASLPKSKKAKVLKHK